jgi:3-dehydroquinate dehydratase-2
MKKILLLNGPNLNLLGKREPHLYGENSLGDIERLTEQSLGDGFALTCFQSNDEAAMLERIHSARGEAVDFILINPAAWTHTSVALRDALAAVDIPFIEIHLSNPHKREPFRHQSYFSDLAVGIVAGFGPQSYALAAMAVRHHFATH